MKTARARASALAACWAIAAGCATLDPIEDGVCGNGIVEPGEDCEKSTAEATCGETHSALACRFTCATGKCPAGFGCGSDTICRAPSGAFDPEVSVPDVDAIALTSGDFDGDRRVDILARTTRRLHVFGLDGRHAEGASPSMRASISSTQNVLSAAAVPDATLELASLQNAMPAVGRFAVAENQPPVSSLALVRPGGFVSVWRGQTDGTLASTVYSAFEYSFRFVLGAGEVVPPTDAAAIGREVLVVSSTRAEPTARGPMLSYIDPQRFGVQDLLPLDHESDAFVGPVQAARFDEGARCDHALLTYAGDAKVRVFALCRPAANNGTQPNASGPGQIPPRDVTLPSGYVLGAAGATIVDFDRDGHLDLVMDGAPRDGGAHAVLVAYGLGDGRFHSASFKGSAPPAVPDGASSAAPPIRCGVAGGFPLAFGHLTQGDDEIDVVLSRGVCYRTGAVDTFLNVGTEVKAAAVADVNANGVADVILSTSSSIEVLSSTGTYAHRFTYPTSDVVTQLVTGDFDGDFIQDVAYRDEASSFGVLYGRSMAAPEAPTRVGRVERTVQMVSGVVSSLGGDPDELADIGLISRVSVDPSRLNVAFVRGSTDRQLEAPFAIRIPEGDGAPPGAKHPYAMALAGGHFMPGDADSLAVLGLDVRDMNVHLWLEPFTGAAEGPDHAVPAASADAIDRRLYEWGNTRAAAIDLVGGGDDPARARQLVFAVPSVSAANDSALWVARVVDGGAFALSPSVTIGSGRAARPFELAVADFDRDGVEDVAVRSVRGDVPALLVFFGDGHGGLVQPATTVEVAGATALSIASLRTKSGSELLIARGGAHQDVSAVEFDGRAARLGRVIIPSIGVPRALATGDWDGDGLDDIAVAAPNHLSVYFAEPENAR